MLLPGIGTAIGGLLGGAGGYVLGEWAGSSAAEAMTDKPNEDNLNVELTVKDDRIMVTKMDGSRRTQGAVKHNTGIWWRRSDGFSAMARPVATGVGE